MPSEHVAPDGGWGWFVVLGSFLLQALTIGITYTFGVLFVALLDFFQAGESTTAWIGSIQPALLYFTGILAGPLIKRFGWRLVTISGSLLSAVGFATSGLAPNIYVLYFTYGVLTGIGNGLMYVTSMVAVQHYFKKHRAMATGIAVSGSGLGTLTFGLLTQALLDALGWRLTVVVLGGIILLGVVCGLLFRPLPEVEEECGDKDHEDSEKSHESSSSSAQPDQKAEFYYADSSTYTEHTPLMSSCGDNFARQPSLNTSASINVVDEQVHEGCCAACCGALRNDVFDTKLWRNPVFLMMCLSIFLFCFGYHVPYTYTPDRAVSAYGIPTTQASMLVSIMGIANVGSRLLFGWIGDKSEAVRFYLGSTMLTLGGVVSVIISVWNTYPLMVAYSVLFGAFTGSWAALFPVIVVDLLGLDIVEKSLGQILATGSVAFLVASPMSGWIIQRTGSYDAPFIVVGVAETVGGIVCYSIACVVRRQRAKAIALMETEERDRATIETTPHVHSFISRWRRRASYMSESFA